MPRPSLGTRAPLPPLVPRPTGRGLLLEPVPRFGLMGRRIRLGWMATLRFLGRRVLPDLPPSRSVARSRLQNLILRPRGTRSQEALYYLPPATAELPST